MSSDATNLRARTSSDKSMVNNLIVSIPQSEFHRGGFCIIASLSISWKINHISWLLEVICQYIQRKRNIFDFEAKFTGTSILTNERETLQFFPNSQTLSLDSRILFEFSQIIEDHQRNLISFSSYAKNENVLQNGFENYSSKSKCLESCIHPSAAISQPRIIYKFD